MCLCTSGPSAETSILRWEDPESPHGTTTRDADRCRMPFMTTAQSYLEPAPPLPSPRRSVIDSPQSGFLARTFSLLVAAALVVLPVAQARSPQRSETTARTSSARVDQSGALPSRGLTSAEGRVRASAFAH